MYISNKIFNFWSKCDSSRPSQLSSSLRRQVWSAVKRLDTISLKLFIMFDPHLGWCNSEIFKVATNIFYPTQDRTRYLLASVTMLLPTELYHLHQLSYATLLTNYRPMAINEGKNSPNSYYWTVLSENNIYSHSEKPIL